MTTLRPSWMTDSVDANGVRYAAILIDADLHVYWRCKHVHRSRESAEYCAGREDRKRQIESMRRSIATSTIAEPMEIPIKP